MWEILAMVPSHLDPMIRNVIFEAICSQITFQEEIGIAEGSVSSNAG